MVKSLLAKFERQNYTYFLYLQNFRCFFCEKSVASHRCMNQYFEHSVCYLSNNLCSRLRSLVMMSAVPVISFSTGNTLL